jgi:glycosyltransferase involved in cell wall biosynthesis
MAGQILFCSDFSLAYHNPEAEIRMSHFVARGWRVVYVEKLGVRNPSPRAVLSRLRPQRRTAPDRSPSRSRRGAPVFETASPTLVFPRRVPGVGVLNRRWLRRQFAAHVDPAATVLWIRFPTPELSELVEEMPWRLVVYELADEHEHGPGITPRLRHLLRATEDRILARAQLAIASSRPVADRLSQRHSNVVLAPAAAVDVERFDPSGNVPERRLAVYAGALDFRFDYELMAGVARHLPEWRFLLAGPADPEGEETLGHLDNVELAGPYRPEELPALLAKAAVCLLPYRRSPLTDTIFPVKLVEYLAAGRPAVSTPIPAVEDLGQLLRLASDARTFADEIERAARADGSEHRAARAGEAARHSWEVRIDQLERALVEASQLSRR